MDERLLSLREYLASQPDVVAAYVFGSVAQGRARPQSDVDIAVLLTADLDEEAALTVGCGWVGRWSASLAVRPTWWS